jgi:effector-binding domain-containing protein
VDVEVTELDGFSYVAWPGQGDPAKGIPQVITALAGIAGPQGLFEHMTGAPFTRYVGITADGSGEMEWEVGFPLAPEAPVAAPLELKRFPGGPFATSMHTGPYEGLSGAYDELVPQVARDYELTGEGLEIYVDDPDQVAVEALRTKLLLGIRRP